MANPDQARDSRGRWARGGKLDSAAAKEEKKDEARLEKARKEARRQVIKDRIEHEESNLSRLRSRKPTRADDPHEVVDWEEEYVATRSRLRSLRQQLKDQR